MALSSLTSFKEGDRRKIINPTPKFDHWKRIFLGGFNSMFILNLFALAAFAPVLYILYAYINELWSMAAVIPFASTIGTGLVTVVDSAEIRNIINTDAYVTYIMMMIPLGILIASTLMSAFSYGMRNAEYDGGVASYKDVFKGLKFNAVKFAGLGIIAAVLFECAAFLYYIYTQMIFESGTSVSSVMLLIGLSLFAAFSLIYLFYCYSLAVTYKMGFTAVLSRAFKFSIHLPIQNLAILILSLCPIAMAALSSFMVSLVITLFLFVGFSFVGSVWTVYTQAVFTIATPQTAKKAKK